MTQTVTTTPQTPTMSLERFGPRKIALVVTGIVPPELAPVLDALGIRLVEGVWNRYQIMCTTPAELDAAREPLRAYFDAQGRYITRAED